MKYSNRSKKSTYGQNFLFNKELLTALLDSCHLQPNDNVLEIGAGAGTLTEILAQRVGKLLALEIDDSLMPYLRALEQKLPNLRCLHCDFMTWDFEEYFRDTPSVKVIANIPYYITTPIYHRLIFSSLPIEELSCMVQLEVAKKILATPEQKNEYGTLALICQHKYNAEIVRVVGKENFSPVPKVDSAFVRLTRKPEASPVDAADTAYYRLVKASFLHRRKTLLNSLKASGYEGGLVAEALRCLEIQENARPENLRYEDYVKLAESLG